MIDKLKEAGVEKVGWMTKPARTVALMDEAVSDVLDRAIAARPTASAGWCWCRSSRTRR